MAGLGCGRACAAKVKQQGLWEAYLHLVAELLNYTQQQQCISAGSPLSI